MDGVFELWVPGYPKAKERPRLGRGRRAFTPQATIEAEDAIASAYEKAEGPRWGPDQGIVAAIDYSPEGQLITLWPAGRKGALRGDIDNYVKLTLDALQKAYDGEAFNDRRVVDLRAAKYPKGWADGRL